MVALASNIKTLTGIPSVMKEAKEHLMEVYEDLMGLIKLLKIKEELNKLKQGGKDCFTKKIADPILCYKEVYGPIKYTV